MSGRGQPQGAPATDKRAYYHLFFAQALALVSTEIATVALALLAYDLAGAHVGPVLRTALAIKMAAYLIVAPIAAAFAWRLPRRPCSSGSIWPGPPSRSPCPS
jgi:hypothetical protein